MNKYEGKDNYGHPRQEYLDKLKAKSDEELFDACKQMIWLSAYANNNPRSVYQYYPIWHYLCCDECQQRGKPEIYQKAYDYNTKE